MFKAIFTVITIIGSFVFVANAKYLLINIYLYHDPITEHAPLLQNKFPAQIIESVIPPKSA